MKIYKYSLTPPTEHHHLTPQQHKIKKLSEIAAVCLRNEKSNNDESLFKCVQVEAESHLNAL